MKRLERDETLHGTENGQIAIDLKLREKFGLSERESAIATLLAAGIGRSSITDRLQISTSVVDKHLGAIRRKLGVSTTSEALAFLVRAASDKREGDFYRWPMAPSFGDALFREGPDQSLAQAVETAEHLNEGLEHLLGHLADDHVSALLYVFLPRNVLSFQRGQWVDRWVGSRAIAAAYEAAGGLTSHPFAARIFNEPDHTLIVDAAASEAIGPSEIWDEAVAGGHRFGLCFGMPIGCGFAATFMLLREEARDVLEREREHATRFRRAFHIAHTAFLANGLLAREANLSLRERNALTHLAEGEQLSAIAEKLGGSERSASDLIRSAREKLGARTNAEAIAEAMARNALVFL